MSPILMGFIWICILFCVYTTGWCNGARREREYWAKRGRAPLPKENKKR